MSVLLLSTYDLGKQPFGLASPAAWLTRAGLEVTMRDLSRDRLDPTEVERASIVAFYLPMHTATRVALPVLDRIRALNPTAQLCAYGLYAPLSEALLREHGVSFVFGPEAEQALVALAAGEPSTLPGLPRLAFMTPERRGLPDLTRYASLRMPDGTDRVVGATDATRGCKHRCRHCPIVPVYEGQFRVVAVDVVLADIDQQVVAGAQHISFGDPDFFNGPTHARKVVEALHARHPSVTYDVTIKVEHLLKHRDLLPLLARTGCAFITSAVEAVDDDVLAKLEKGHTRADFVTAAALCRHAGVPLSPTFVAFTPWTTIEGYRDLVVSVAELGLVEHVAPVQWGLRLLVTHNSRLLELDDIRTRVQPFDRVTLTYPWVHDDPRVDAMQADVMRAVGVSGTRPRAEIFATVSKLAGVDSSPSINRATIPYLDEPWYC
ncbi:MAG: radical SAM protein [Acidobacteria bacterium]|nr:radical SAM protein [Acidobacteriota bacterium]